MSKLLHMLEHTAEVELSCDEVFSIIDQYVELEACGEDAKQLMPLIRKHLDKCHDCLEEYEALTRVIKASTDLPT